MAQDRSLASHDEQYPLGESIQCDICEDAAKDEAQLAFSVISILELYNNDADRYKYFFCFLIILGYIYQEISDYIRLKNILNEDFSQKPEGRSFRS